MILRGANVLTLSISYSKHFLPYVVLYEDDAAFSEI